MSTIYSDTGYVCHRQVTKSKMSTLDKSWHCFWMCFVTLTAHPRRLSHLKQAEHVTQLLKHQSIHNHQSWFFLWGSSHLSDDQLLEDSWSFCIYFLGYRILSSDDRVTFSQSYVSYQMFLATLVLPSWYEARAMSQVRGRLSKETALGSKSAPLQTLYQLLRSGRGNQTLIDACWSRYSLQPATTKI